MTVEEDSVRVRLMVKPNSKVCLFHARKNLLPPFMAGDLNLMLDWAENECDSVIYWLQPNDEQGDIMAHLEQQIKPSGRIWLVLSAAPQATIERIRQDVSDYTNLRAGKVVDIGENEVALLFALRKSALEDKES
ncbi:MAG: hypothetical protein FWF98_04750 [Dehalococcoidia bacterium]|nr:hypothetical protein [Dehalococcoidia bacterium]